VADLAGGVDRRRILVERRQVLVEGRKELLRLAGDDVERRWRIARDRKWREADAAIAGDDRGHALAGLARQQRVAQQRTVVMGVGVDKARGEREALRGDLPVALDLGEVAHRDDAVVGHREVAAPARRTAAVDQQRIADHEVGSCGGAGWHGGLRKSWTASLAARLRLSCVGGCP
jgi:hypothetical protein